MESIDSLILDQSGDRQRRMFPSRQSVLFQPRGSSCWLHVGIMDGRVITATRRNTFQIINIVVAGNGLWLESNLTSFTIGIESGHVHHPLSSRCIDHNDSSLFRMQVASSPIQCSYDSICRLIHCHHHPMVSQRVGVPCAGSIPSSIWLILCGYG